MLFTCSFPKFQTYFSYLFSGFKSYLTESYLYYRMNLSNAMKEITLSCFQESKCNPGTARLLLPPTVWKSQSGDPPADSTSLCRDSLTLSDAFSLRTPQARVQNLSSFFISFLRCFSAPFPSVPALPFSPKEAIRPPASFSRKALPPPL